MKLFQSTQSNSYLKNCVAVNASLRWEDKQQVEMKRRGDSRIQTWTNVLYYLITMVILFESVESLFDILRIFCCLLYRVKSRSRLSLDTWDWTRFLSKVSTRGTLSNLSDFSSSIYSSNNDILPFIDMKFCFNGITTYWRCASCLYFEQCKKILRVILLVSNTARIILLNYIKYILTENTNLVGCSNRAKRKF